ncbi:MAG: Xaa-Pro peptidase family protein [Desulfohalobiaceae bacterium]
MPPDILTQRRQALRAKLEENSLDAYLVLHPANRFYLSSFELHDPQCNESAGCLLLTAQGRDFLLTDPRYAQQARSLWQEQNLCIYRQDRNHRLAELLHELGAYQVGFESRTMNYETYAALQDKVHLQPCPGLVEDLRRIKDQEEIERLRTSCKLNHQVLTQLEQELLRPGVSEKELAWELEKLFKEGGASELAFPPIVALGKNAALPHHLPGPQQLQKDQPLLVDTGARLEGYCSDQSRTYWLGAEPMHHFCSTLELVRQAQNLALESIEPEMPVKELYQKVYDFFASQGVEEHFTHALGHGIGLETHEAPSLGPKSQDILQPGMVITIEPGLYYPEWGGVRWEYMVLVTQQGAQVL